MALPGPIIEAILRLRDEMSPALATTSQHLQAAGDRMERTGRQMARAGDRLTVGVTAPIIGLGAAAFKMASDAEEAANKFNVVMGGSADEVRARLEELTATIPLTRSEMEGLAAGIQDMLVPLGIARDEAAGMSGDFVELAGDLGSFNNVPTAQVLEDIKSALAGSSEPMRKYGVDTRVAALEQVALEAGLIQAGEAMDQQTAAQAVLLQITRQSTDAIGDAARTTESASNSTKFLWRDLKDLGETIGRDLIPVITPLINDLRSVLGWLKELDPATRQWVLRSAALAAALGPVLSITGRLVGTAGSVVGAVGRIAGSLGGASGAGGLAKAASVGKTAISGLIGVVTGPVGLVAAAGAAGVAVGRFIDKTTGIGDIIEEKTGIFQSFADWWLEVPDNVEEAQAALDAVNAEVAAVGGNIKVVSDNAGRVIPVTQEWKDALNDTADAGRRVNDVVDDFPGTADEATRAMWALVNSIEAYNVAQFDAEIGQIRQNELLTDFSVTLPSVPPKIKQVAEETKKNAKATKEAAVATRDATIGFSDFSEILRTGNRWIDQATQLGFKLVDSLIGGGGLSSAFKSAGDAAGGFFGKLSSLFSGGGGLGGLLGGLIPGGGLIGAGIGALGGLIGKLFGGGPSEEEKEARGIYSDINAQLQNILTAQDKVIAGGEQWKITNIAVNRIYEALGKSSEEAAAMAKRLVESVRGTPEEARAAAEEIGDLYEQAMDKMAESTSSATESAAEATSDAAHNAQEAYDVAIREVERIQQQLTGTTNVEAQKQLKIQLDLAQQVAEKWRDKMEDVKRTTSSASDKVAENFQRAADTVSTTWSGIDLELPVRFNTDGLSIGGRDVKLPSFDRGGTIPGPLGKPRVVIAHGGETVNTPGDNAALINEMRGLRRDLKRANEVGKVTSRARSLMGLE